MTSVEKPTTMYVDIPQALDALEKHRQQITQHHIPESLYKPRDYIMDMRGKKFRALMTILGCALYRDDYQSALTPAYAVELFHNFTLVHDDIMDRATHRRGQLVVHQQYSEPAAILTGDVMMIEVFSYLNMLSDSHYYVNRMCQIARLVCEGQAMDMDFENDAEVSISDYLKMIELKTAVLLGLALEFGAKSAGAPPRDLEHLYKFAVNAGIGFQLQDDYLDVYGDPEVFGKKWGGDILQGKKTYLYLRAMALLEGQARADFQKLYYRQEALETKVSEVKAVFDELYLETYCEETKNAFFDLATGHLEVVSASQKRKDELREFARSFLDREK